MTDIFTLGLIEIQKAQVNTAIDNAKGKIPGTRTALQKLEKDMNYILSISGDLYRLGDIVVYFKSDIAKLLIVSMVLPKEIVLDFSDKAVDILNAIQLALTIESIVLMFDPILSAILFNIIAIVGLVTEIIDNENKKT